MKVVHLDLETRSAADLPSVGAQRYAMDPQFEILMASVGCAGESAMWVNPLFGGSPDNERAEAMLEQADEIYAHNAPFELACLWGAMQQGKANPVAIPVIDRMRCTAAMARKAGLPYSLAKLAEALNLSIKKDTKGRALIKLFSMPQKDGTFVDPAAHPQEWQEFQDYCRVDREVEQAIHAKLKPFELTGAAFATFQFDLRMNLRGIPINVEGAKKAQVVIESVQADVLEEFQKLTGLNPTQREKIRELVGLPDMQGETLTGAIAAETDERKRRILELYGKLSYAAVKKIQTMLDCVCPDGRVRGGHMYYGAGTGRWSGQLLQPQNFKKTSVEFRKLTDMAYRDICAGMPAKAIEALYGDPLEVISYCIRHFIHAPGHEMLDADYAAVEARIVCWLAGQEDALEEYRAGVDRYQIMAAEIYRKSIADIKALGKDSDERQLGKMAILGAGFGMGATKFRESCRVMAGIDISEDLAAQAVEAFRRKHSKVVQYWYLMDENCKNAVKRPGATFGCFSTRVVGGIPFLLLRLRSGRSLAYPHPQISVETYVTKTGETRQGESVTYWGQLPGTVNWGRVKLYGGKLAENCLGEGTEVLTPLGWIPIELITPDDLVWDGEQWVNHDGVICKGDQPTIDFGGLQLTPDHEVFVETGKVAAIDACLSSALETGLIAWQNLDSTSKDEPLTI